VIALRILLGYFLRPFPKAEGFSPYRFPGFAAHLPIWGLIAGMGFYWCWPVEGLRPLIALWILAGLYLGRDLAIMCHYMGCLGFLPMALFLVLISKGPVWLMPVKEFADYYGRFHYPLAWVQSGLLAFVWGWAVWSMVGEAAAEVPEEDVSSETDPDIERDLDRLLDPNTDEAGERERLMEPEAESTPEKGEDK
jgi:hypothetical protein